MTLSFKATFTPPAQGHLIYTIDTTEGGTRPTNVDFTLLATLVNDSYEVAWGDGTSETALASVPNLSHTYATPGTYTVEVFPSGTYRPFFADNNNDADLLTNVSVGADINVDTSFFRAFDGADRLVEFNCNPGVTSNATTFQRSWRNCSSLTSFPLIDTSSGTNFQDAWQNCTSLTSFPLIDTSSGTAFQNAWQNCSSLTSFPLIDTSSATNLVNTWVFCTSLTSFPLISTSSVTNFSYTWSGCSGLTSFPQLDVSNVTTFSYAWSSCTSLTSFPLLNVVKAYFFTGCWQGCSSLVTFPANFFDNWTATPLTSCFNNAWDGCTSLSATSVENILNSIDTSGRSAPASGVDITIDYNAGSGTPNISTAVANLKGRGWTITLNGVAQ